MDREKKSAGQPWADLAADYGAEILLVLQPEPEAVAGLVFCADRVQWRRMGLLAAALGAALGGQVGPEMFEAMADSPEEGQRAYWRYIAHQKLDHAVRAATETF